MPPPLKRESWSLDDITMLGAAGGAGWSSFEEDPEADAVAAVVAAAGGGSLLLEIIVDVVDGACTCSLFSFLPLLFVLFCNAPSSSYPLRPLFRILTFFFFRLSLSLSLSKASTATWAWGRPNIWKLVNSLCSHGNLLI